MQFTRRPGMQARPAILPQHPSSSAAVRCLSTPAAAAAAVPRQQLSCCSSSRAGVQPTQQQQQQQQQQVAGRVHAAMLAGLVWCSPLVVPAAWAESPADCSTPDCGVALPANPFGKGAEAQRQKLSAADDNFRNSDTLKQLLERSAANKDKNKKAIVDKYCYRQAELGVGDCGGLRFIPGMTKNGKQKTPKWLKDALGVKQPPMEGDGLTLSDLLGPNAGQ